MGLRVAPGRWATPTGDPAPRRGRKTAAAAPAAPGARHRKPADARARGAREAAPAPAPAPPRRRRAGPPPLRERPHPRQVPRPRARHLRAGRPERRARHRQEEVPRARGPDGGPVHLRHPQTHQAAAREGHLHLRRQRHPADGVAHVGRLRGPEGRGRLPLRDVLGREHVRLAAALCSSLVPLSVLSLFLPSIELANYPATCRV